MNLREYISINWSRMLKKLEFSFDAKIVLCLYVTQGEREY